MHDCESDSALGYFFHHRKCTSMRQTNDTGTKELFDLYEARKSVRDGIIDIHFAQQKYFKKGTRDNTLSKSTGINMPSAFTLDGIERLIRIISFLP